MAYIFGLFIVALFFVSLHYFTELSKSQKTITSLIVFALISAAIAYNSYTDAQTDEMMQVVTKFKQNKTVTCSGVDINASNFSLSVGTYTFIGKKDTPYYGQMISASECQ